MEHPYHLHLTSECDPDGAVWYWAEYRELPLLGYGTTKQEAIEKLIDLRNAYLSHLETVGAFPKPFISGAIVIDWTNS